MQIDLPKTGALLPGFFALTRSGLNKETPVSVPGTKFVDLCDEYFRVVEDVESKRPYFYPLDGSWKADNWPRGSIFTRWKDLTALTKSGKLKVSGSGENWSWKLDEGYETQLPKYVRPNDLIPFNEFAIWVLRSKRFQEDKALAEIKQLVRQDLKLENAAFVRLFSEDLTRDTEAITEEEWADSLLLQDLPEPQQVLQGTVESFGEPTSGLDDETDEPIAEEAVPAPTEDELVRTIHRYVRNEANLDIDEELIQNLLTSMTTDRFAVLVGKPGTGKTEFVKAFADGLELALRANCGVHLIDVEVGEDFAEHQLVGYRDLAGRYVSSATITGLLEGNPERDIYIVMLDEMNLASVDAYAGGFVAAVKSGIPVALPGKPDDPRLPPDGQWLPPPGTFVIGTMNSYLEDPSRKMLSTPVKRRANAIQMPNPLEDMVRGAAGNQTEARKRFDDTCQLLMRQSLRRLTRKAQVVLDAHRAERLRGAVPEDVLDIIWCLSRALAQRPEVPMTLGPVQSILEYIQTSSFKDRSVAVDLQIVQKVIPLLRGDVGAVDAVEACLFDGSYPRSRGTLAEVRRLAALNQDRIRPLF